MIVPTKKLHKMERALLQTAYKVMPETQGLSILEHRIADRNEGFFIRQLIDGEVVFIGAVITERNKDTGELRLNAAVGAGVPFKSNFDEQFEFMKKAAQVEGATSIFFPGRISWGRILEKYGFVKEDEYRNRNNKRCASWVYTVGEDREEDKEQGPNTKG